MFTSSDIKHFAKYISQSATELEKNSGKNIFFVPFFVELEENNFKQSVVISSLYLNLFEVPRNNSNLFKFNTVIPNLVQHSTGIPSCEFIYKCHNINNDIKKHDSIDVNYSYLLNQIEDLCNERNV